MRLVLCSTLALRFVVNYGVPSCFIRPDNSRLIAYALQYPLALIPRVYEPTVMPVVGIFVLWKVRDLNPRSPVGLAHICAAFNLGGLSPSFSANLPPLLCRAVFPLGLFCFVFYCLALFRTVCFVSSFNVPCTFPRAFVLFRFLCFDLIGTTLPRDLARGLT